MLAIAEPRAKPKAQCFYRPDGTDLPFTSFPSPAAAAYWATFTESLRDKSPHHTILALMLRRMGGCRTRPTCAVVKRPAYADAHGRLPETGLRSFGASGTTPRHRMSPQVDANARPFSKEKKSNRKKVQDMVRDLNPATAFALKIFIYAQTKLSF